MEVQVISKNFSKLFGKKFENVPAIMDYEHNILFVNSLYSGKNFKFFSLILN